MRRTVPWANPEEWKYIFKLFYDSNPIQNKLAVDRVKAWNSRGKVPHAIESTSILTEVGLQDTLSTMSTCSPKELSLLFAMALIRFVNGIIDSGQKGVLSASAAGIAEQMVIFQS